MSTRISLEPSVLVHLSPFHVLWQGEPLAAEVTAALHRAWGVRERFDPMCLKLVRPFHALLTPSLFDDLTGMALTVTYDGGSGQEMRSELIDLGEGRWMLACMPRVASISELEAGGLRLGDLPMFSGLGDALVAVEAAHVSLEESQRSLARVEASNAALERMNEVFSRFVPRQFLRALGLDSPLDATLGAHMGSVSTMMFADLRSFTSISEGLSSERIFALINCYLERIAPHIRSHRGFVVHYLGDGILAMFATPAHGVRAAIAMQEELARLGAEQLLAHMLPPGECLRAGIGLHHGRIQLGIVGEGGRLDSAVISDAVNITARLESLTRRFDCSTLISGSVRSSLGTAVTPFLRKIGTFVLKGRTRAVEVHEVFADDPPALRESKLAQVPLLDRMLQAWTERQPQQALEHAEQLVAACPQDGPARWWRSHLAEHLKHPQGEPLCRDINLEAK